MARSHGVITDAGIGLTALGARHFVAAEAEEYLRGQRASPEAFAQAGAIAAANCRPSADQRGPEDYKRHLAGELTRRALGKAARRAGLLASPGGTSGVSPRTPGGKLAMKITVYVNGAEHARDVEPRLLLIHFIRDELGLTGSHWGCDTSNCGACVVWLDEVPVKSCTVLAVMADGRRVTTVEGSRAAPGSTRSSRGSPPATGCNAAFALPG